MEPHLKNLLLIICCLAFTFTISSAADKSTIYGKVVDKKTGETLIGVNVIIKGTTTGASTDLDGKYQIKDLDSGTYSIAATYVSYSEQTINDVHLEPGKSFQLDIAMAQSAQEIKAVEITASANRQAVSTLLMTIKNSTSIADGISQDVIKRTPDKNTGEVLKRISGTSVQDNKFVVVRGLNDRYNYTLVNGMPFSSTEPDRKAVSFDVFPASIVDNILISKTATPDLPGEFAGGVIQLNTRDIPEDNNYLLLMGAGTNSQTTFKPFYHAQKGGTDWLGFDDGTREMPKFSYSPTQVRNLEIEERVQFSKKFKNDWKLFEDASAKPNYSFQGAMIKNFKIGGADAGIFAGLTYNNSRKTKVYDLQSFEGLGDTAANAGVFRYHDVAYINNVLIGGILNFALKTNENNKITWKNTWTQNGDDNARLKEGLRIKENTKVIANVIEYTSTHVITSQLQGNHYMPKSKVKFQWGLSAGNVYRNVPDVRQMSYTNNPNSDDTTLFYASIPFTPSPSYAGKVYSQLEENVFNEMGDLTIPLTFLKGKQEIKAGTLIQQKFREFRTRHFGYKIANAFSYNYNNLLLPQDSLFMPEMVSDTGIVLDELTNPYDKYTADVHLTSFYVMFDNSILKNLRLLWGMRYELFHQRLVTKDQVGKKANVNRSEPDWMPSANLIWSVTEKLNVRLSASRTVARPEFREIAQLNVYDFNTESNFVGNDSLVRSKIENYDMRVEFYPHAAQVISITGFYKNFIDPIEQVVSFQGSNRVYSYQNVVSATNYGMEFEFRIKPSLFVDLDESSFFNSFTLFSNLALIHSRVDLGNVLGITDTVRPLQGQSPYVFNAGLQFLNERTGLGLSAVFNRIGDRIDAVGGFNYFSVIEAPRSVFDFQISKLFFKKAEIKFTVNDIFNQKGVTYWDVNDNNKYDEGADNYIEKVQYGTNYSFSLSYKF